VNLERFQQEIATAATLQHPQIVPVYHAGDHAGLRYYVMPFIAGESLRERLRRDGTLSARDVVHLVAPLARALAYAHRQGVVHRDVKPENILLSEGEPMLADFGIAKVVREGSSATGLTSAGMSIGTVTYMPPEQVAADPDIDGRADVYSLAAVAYELLTGAPPFTGSPQQIMAAHLAKAPGAAAVRSELAALRDAPGAVFGRVIAGLALDAPDVLFDGLARAAIERDQFVLLLPLRDPWYDRLRRDPRFAELAERLGLPAASIAPIGAGTRNGG
jgi:serine/threonine-protein kinase